jgi:hypothetical protein
MKLTYTEIVSPINGEKIILRNNPDGSVSSIPVDEANSDYQAYLNPEAEQSTPIESAE